MLAVGVGTPRATQTARGAVCAGACVVVSASGTPGGVDHQETVVAGEAVVVGAGQALVGSVDAGTAGEQTGHTSITVVVEEA